MKKITWINHNRMLMETGHKTFDRQTNIVSICNINANTQISFCVRGELDCASWGGTRSPGFLRDFDLNGRRIPHHVRAYIMEQTDNTSESVWMCELFHYNGRRRIVHGYIITKPDHTLLRTFITGPTHKSKLVIEGVLPYVTETRP